MTSAFVCVSLGIAPTVRHADYLGSWLTVLREDDHAIVRAASAASKAADYLLAFRPDPLQPLDAISRPTSWTSDDSSSQPNFRKDYLNAIQTKNRLAEL